MAESITGTAGLTDPDDVPEPPEDAITQPGDLWILGDHRLLCGDSGSVEDVDRLLAGAKLQLVNTDPQSFFGRESRWNGPAHCLPGGFRFYFRGLRGSGRSAAW